MKELLDELWDEATDFFEDYAEHLFHRKPKSVHKNKPTIVNGAMILVRPAYLFAERLDNLIKIIFGISIVISAISASLIGFTSMSDFLEFLINSSVGRTGMILIGTSYLLTAFWRILHLGQKSQ
jgi:hypothetical protein